LLQSNDPTDERVAKDVRKLRLSHGLPQAELADMLNLSVFEMEWIESGCSRVSTDTLSDIAHVLGVSFFLWFYEHVAPVAAHRETIQGPMYWAVAAE
jgi:transcriptional regulator with XRE-family HTH domain